MYEHSSGQLSKLKIQDFHCEVEKERQLSEIATKATSNSQRRLPFLSLVQWSLPKSKTKTI